MAQAALVVIPVVAAQVVIVAQVVMVQMAQLPHKTEVAVAVAVVHLNTPRAVPVHELAA